MPGNGDGISADRLQLAVVRGVITAEQRDQLLELERASSGAVESATETPRGFNAIYLVYWAGAAAVLFALGWFLVDRWRSLRPGGVLAVSLLYALSFALSSLLLTRLRFRSAAALFALLAVGMAPIVAWSLLSLAGWWPEPMYRRGDILVTIRWIPIELSAALAALVALRKVRFSVLALAVAVPVGLAIIHLTPLLFDSDVSDMLWGPMILVAATILFAAGYVVERRTVGESEDYAGFIYVTALGFLVAAVIGIVAVFDESRVIRHALPLLVALLVALGIALKRSFFALFAGIFYVWYLGFLADDVFQTATGFMLVVVAGGALLIFAAVLVQRRFPGLLRRGAGTRRPEVRGARYLFSAAVTVSLLFLVVSIPRSRELYRRNAARSVQRARDAAQFRRSERSAPQARAIERERRETPSPARP
jgi:hypothetical protein